MGEKFNLAPVFSRKLILLLQINEHGDPPFFICYLDILSILSYSYIYVIIPGVTLDMKWNAPRRLFIISYPTRARGIIEFHCIKNSNTYWLLVLTTTRRQIERSVLSFSWVLIWTCVVHIFLRLKRTLFRNDNHFCDFCFIISIF